MQPGLTAGEPSQARKGGKNPSRPPHRGIEALNRQLKLRISHACDRCRAMRVRCSGDLRCAKCTKDDAECRYSDRRREENKKNYSVKTHRIKTLEDEKELLVAVLRDICKSPGLQPSQHSEALLLLQKVSEDVSSENPEPMSPSRSRRTSSSLSRRQDTETLAAGGEIRTLLDTGSHGVKGGLTQRIHLDGGSGLVGYVGKMSEVSWLRRVHEYLTGGSASPDIGLRRNEPASATTEPNPIPSYLTDEEDVLAVNEDFVNSGQIPPLDISLVLGQAFFHSLQGSFPFLLHRAFLDDLPTIFSPGFPSSWADRRLLALCNVVWATGAKWLQATRMVQDTFAEHHQIYYARARALGLDHRILSDHPNLRTLQGMGILAFYLFVNGSIQRAWNVLGQAIRLAISLGLHVKTPSHDTDDDEREKRISLWHALYRLETLLAEILGRPKSIQAAELVADLTTFRLKQEMVSFPDTRNTKLRNESHTLWMQFIGKHRWAARAFSGTQVPWDRFHAVGLGIPQSYITAALCLSQISTEVAAKVYSDSPHQTWYDVQRAIEDLEETLQSWMDNLSEELDLQTAGDGEFDPRPNLELAMYRRSVQMLLYRPCLCETEIENESARSKEFNTSRARLCVEAALNMISLLPDGPVETQVLQILPWWSTLHYICQAGTVLLLELCLDMQHMEGETILLETGLRKVLSYLWSLSHDFKSAYMAYQILRLFSERVTRRYRPNSFVSGATEPPLPRNWNDNDASMMMSSMMALQ